MCKEVSFLYKSGFETVELRLHDLTSHSNTQTKFPECTEKNGWYEGHYTPQGEVELRTPTGRDQAAEEWLRSKYPTFDTFIWSLFLSGDLPYSPCGAVEQALQGHGVQQ